MLKDTITFPDFIKLDLRVGTIKTAEKVAGSERLIKLEINLGEEIGQRMIIAGIALQYEPENLVGKQVVVAVNLEPKKMMGMESQGMVLAAGDSEIALLTPDKPIEDGKVVR
jgi:methionine--tRNA ligase beta chain